MEVVKLSDSLFLCSGVSGNPTERGDKYRVSPEAVTPGSGFDACGFGVLLCCRSQQEALEKVLRSVLSGAGV